MDAREAHPLWLSDDSDLLHVRAVHAHDPAGCDAARAPGAKVFDLWRIPGRKRLDGAHGAVLTATNGAHRARILLDAALADGSVYACSVPLTPQLRGQLGEFHAIAVQLDGDPPPRAAARPTSRTGLLHLRALQALDAAQAQASHRDLAIAFFGLQAVREQWHADGALRAQVRHVVSRAEGLMRHGYLRLAGVRHAPADAPGDETAH